MYLRTQCDRELYLSLFSNSPVDLKAAGLPIPLKSRPGVQLITTSGTAFELEQYNKLCTYLPNNVFQKSNGAAKVDLVKALKASKTQTLILQPTFEPEAIRDFALKSLGVKDADVAAIPRMSDLRPDIILVQERAPLEYEILPDGSRRQLTADDKRFALSVVDLKNVTEANASYSAEVCLYAIFLSSWLHTTGKEFLNTHFVSDRLYLWKHIELPTFTKILATKEGADHAKRFSALMADLSDGQIKYLVYMPSVRRFFADDLPRVVRQGDDHGWATVPYHVNMRCSSCDWLGNRHWLTSEDQKNFDAHPDHYCTPAAKAHDHLSQMPSLSKGASQILRSAGHQKVASLAGIHPDEDVLREHALLKKDRAQIGDRATSITSGKLSVDQVAKVAGLAKSIDAEFDIVVNFDAGSGFLTGVAIRGTLFSPYGEKFPTDDGKGASLLALGEAAFVVPKDLLVAEWASLSGFIEKFAEWLDKAEKIFSDNKFGTVRTQVYFWEVRQYEELCNAFGRHLLSILDLPVRSQRALAWIFPAEELLEKVDHICPNIVFLRDIVTASVRSPQQFVTTLLGTAEHYHHERLTPRNIDSYYVEPLGNSVPRERIFEIWKTATGTVRMYGKDVPVSEAIERYGVALKAHAWALTTIAARLRTDLKNCIDGKARELSMSIPQGMKGVAYDSKVWDRWAQVSAAVDKTEALGSFVSRVEWLEASYRAIVLTKLIKDHGGYRYEFTVSDDSTEAKVDVGLRCALGIVGEPGFALQRPAKFGIPTDKHGAYMPMYSVFYAQIESFDRVGKRVIIRFEPQWKMDDIFDAIMKAGVIPVGKRELYLLEGMPFDDADETNEILSELGDPACASVSREAKLAMGNVAAKKISPGKDPCPPIARVLWEGDKLAKSKIRTAVDVGSLVTYATTANSYPLNPSQIRAVKACAENQLAIVWGPPGTGKTDTLVAFIQAVVREGKFKKILITGPNYRTVEELSGRLCRNLGTDKALICDYFWYYSKNRAAKMPPTVAPHVNVKVAFSDGGTPEYQEMAASLSNAGRITIISTTAHMTSRLIRNLGGDNSRISEVFDVVIIDESSQVPVTLALKPLGGLKEQGQLVVAGDSMQMPPIQSLEPPAGAEYLVGSIQKYLVDRFKLQQYPLLVNYRSNQDLVDYARSLGYPNELKAETSKKDLKIIANLDLVLDLLPSDLPATTGYNDILRPEVRVSALVHDDGVSSQANEVEAGLVAGLSYALRHSVAKNLDTGISGKFDAFTDDEFFSSGIGIVTPHKAQKALVIRKLTALFPGADPAKIFDAVDTVERFQGGERDTIIISYGVGDTDIIEGEEEFLMQLERTNVAVSRARAKCIMLMPRALAYHLPTDQKVAETSVALKAYLEEFCSQRKSVTIAYKGVNRSAEVRWH